jgi:hypothetical protein
VLAPLRLDWFQCHLWRSATLPKECPWHLTSQEAKRAQWVVMQCPIKSESPCHVLSPKANDSHPRPDCRASGSLEAEHQHQHQRGEAILKAGLYPAVFSLDFPPRFGQSIQVHSRPRIPHK